MKIVAAKKILRANEKLASENRKRLDDAGVYCINLVGSPGSGKTSLLQAIFAHARTSLRPAVIEGDLASQIDAETSKATSSPSPRLITLLIFPIYTPPVVASHDAHSV